MPQAARAQTAGAAGAAAAGAAASTGAAGAKAAGAAIAGATAALGVATAGIMAGLVAFLARLREQHRAFLITELARYSTQPDDIAAAIAGEMQLEQEFAKNSADRVASALPQALRIEDPVERRDAASRIFADEERYAQQRSEAMLARAIAAVTRAQLRRDSPLGAFWRLGLAKDHTEGCLAMHGKFWPWAVLDRVHPPRHHGCTSSLHGFGEAIHNGWMSPGDVPNTRDAIRAASGVVMEAEVAAALERELDVRDRLLEQGVSAGALAKVTWHGLQEGADGSGGR